MDTTTTFFLPSHTPSQPPLTLPTPPQQHRESEVWLPTTSQRRPVTKSPAPIPAAFLPSRTLVIFADQQLRTPAWCFCLFPPPSSGQRALPTLGFSLEPRFPAPVPPDGPTYPPASPGSARCFSHPEGQGNTTATRHGSIPPLQAKERPLAPRPGRLPAPPPSPRPAATALTTWG